MALSDFPRFPLLLGPSPVHRLDRLTEHLGGLFAHLGGQPALNGYSALFS